MSDTDSAREFICPECNRQITVGATGIEYGHCRNGSSSKRDERCPRRPACVDPDKPHPDVDTISEGEA